MNQPMASKETTAARLLDEYLVVAARMGDRQSFERLAQRWDRKLIAHARRLTGDREMAMDAAQAGWIEIARGLSRLQDERAFPAWAYRIVSRRCARAIGAVRRDRALDHAVVSQSPTAPAADPGDPGEASRLRAAVRDLPGPQRAAVALFYFEEMSIAQVAVALDVPAGTVKTRLMHARRTLRDVLEGNYDNA